MDNLTGSSNLPSLRFSQHSHTTHAIIIQSNKNTKISKKKKKKKKLLFLKAGIGGEVRTMFKQSSQK